MRLFDCTEAPKPSVTLSRKNNVAPATVKVGAVNVALRGVPETGVRVTLATGHDGAHGGTPGVVGLHPLVGEARRRVAVGVVRPRPATVIVTSVPRGREAGVADGVPSVGARLALICTVVNAGALATPNGTSVTTSWNFSVVDAAKCGETNVGLAAVGVRQRHLGRVAGETGSSVVGSTCVHCVGQRVGVGIGRSRTRQRHDRVGRLVRLRGAGVGRRRVVREQVDDRPSRDR